MRTYQPAAQQTTAAPLVMRKTCSCGRPVGPTGECAECRRKRLGIQTKLKVNEPGDKYEQEADRIAEQVMRMPESLVQRQVEPEEEEEMIQAKPLANQITPLIQRQVEPDEEEEIQAKEVPAQIPEVTLRIQDQINSLRGGGRPLSTETRAYFEPRIGYDFGQVHLHSDALAAEVADSLGAKAFTFGSDLVFGSGQYTPQTTAGRKLLAHELVHVVQQRQKHSSTWQGGLQRVFEEPADILETEQERVVPPRVFKMGKSLSLANQSLNVDIDLSGRARVLPIGSRGGTSLRESWDKTFQEEFSAHLKDTSLAELDPIEVQQTLESLPKPFQIEQLEILGMGEHEIEASLTPVFGGMSGYQEAERARRLAAIEATLSTLNPEKSPRYETQKIKWSEEKEVRDFRCNTYATDFIDLIADMASVLSAYIPKVWWADPIAAKKPSTDLNSASVLIQSPQRLNKWLREWGGEYGWVEITDPEKAGTIAQEKANQGILVLYSLTNHIGLIVAETASVSAKRAGGKVTRPVISQAGVKKVNRAQKKFALDFDTTWLYYYDPSQDKSIGGTTVRR